jgi:hypothetical protein
MAESRKKSSKSTWTRFHVGRVADDPSLRGRPVAVGYANAREMVAERPRLRWLQTAGYMPLNRQILSDSDNRVTMEERRYLVASCRKQTVCT